MKYILFLCCALICQQFLVDNVFAQSDTVTLVLQNTPATACHDFKDYNLPPGHFCDSIKPYSFQSSFVLSSIRYFGDTIEYSLDTNYDGMINGESESATNKLRIIFTQSDSSSANIILRAITTSRAESKISDVTEGIHTVDFSIEGVRFFRKGRTLSASLFGDNIINNHFHFKNYSGSSYTGIGRSTYSYETDSTEGTATESSSITINLSTRAILGVNSNRVPSDMELSVFPNPSSNTISVTSKKTEPVVMEIFNQLGQRVSIFRNVGFDQPFQLNVSAFPSGIYRIRVGDEMQKFIVQH